MEVGKISADGVANVACEPTGMSMRNNCWRAIECRGGAVKRSEQ
ncbi:MAG TPA: hypothetical protein VEK57_25035 [Thermoanaerobaculia bacterium]|nr:hypothetical protein [Thermoanaerobaculia bacterium]